VFFFSVYNGMPTATTSQLVPVTKQFDYGMCRVVSVSGFLLVTGVWFCLWQCLLMVAIWHLGMKMARSWCGTSLVAAVSHLWLGTRLVSGPLHSGDPLLLYFISIRKWIKGFWGCYLFGNNTYGPLIMVGCISSEGSILASGSADSTVKLWDVNTSTKVSRAEEK